MMKLYRSDSLIKFEDGNLKFSVSQNDIDISESPTGSNIADITLRRINGIVKRTRQVSEILDFTGNVYGTTVDDVIFAIFNWQEVNILDQNGECINVQNPLPTDGDSVYCKDIDLTNSSIGNFTGAICDLFDNYTNTNVAAAVGSSGVNPKSFQVTLKRPIVSSTIGVGSPDTTISNAKLTLFGLAGDVIKIVDFSSDDTKLGVLIFQFEQKIFISALIEFYTDDEVTLGGAGMTKSVSVSIEAINGVISDDNSTETPLLANAEFPGGIIDTKNYGIVICSTYSNVASAVNGLVIEFSKNKLNWRWFDKYTIAADTGKTFSVQPQARWMKVRYLNGPVNQDVFELETQLKPVYIKPSSHRVGDPISPEDDAELQKAVLTGLSDINGIFENVKTYRGALQVDEALVHKVGISEHVKRDLGASTTLDVAASTGDVLINVAATTGFVADDLLRICNATETVCERSHFHITAVDPGVSLTLDRPLDNDYEIGDDVIEMQIGMNVDGTLLSPISFKLEPTGTERWQITRILPTMLDDSAMDDGKFGGIGALDNGVILRTFINGVFRTIAVWKSNADLKDDMYDVTYSSKAPAGQHGLSARWTFTRAEFIVDLDGANGDYLEVLIQDPLSGLLDFEIKGQGRLFGS